MDFRRSSYIALIFAVVMLIVAVPGVWAQDDDDAGPAVITEFGSPYIRVAFGDFVTVQSDNNFVLHGSHLVMTQEGDPDTVGDNDREILIGYWKMKVGDQILVVGDPGTGSWTKTLTTYKFPPAGMGLGRTGGFIEGEWTAKASESLSIKFHIRTSIVRDQVRYEATISHNGTTPQSIAVGMHAYVINALSRTIGYPFIPGRGINKVGAYPERVAGMLLQSPHIPKSFDIYDDMEKPATVVRGILGEADATMPDYLAIADHYEDLYDINNWIVTDYVPDPMRPIDDFEYATVWNAQAIAPGGSRKIITYTGCGAASAHWTNVVNKKIQQDYAVLAVQGPRTLKYDSTTPSSSNSLDPQPFTVKAYVYNLNRDPGPYAMSNVTATLFLPPGLELEPETDNTPTKVIGPVPSNSESKPVTWRVRATGQYCGELEYSVSASDPTGWQQTTARKIMVPATKKSVLRYGWQLINVPFTFRNAQADHVLGLQWGTFGALRWDPLVSSITNNYLPVTQIEPGKAFWVRVATIDEWNETQPLQLATDAAITGEVMGKQDIDQMVRVEPGWNMIGNPLVYPVYWGQVQVYHEVTNVTVSLDQAVDNEWISKTLFSWNPDKWVYDAVKDNDVLLDPWKGYWLRAKQPVTLIFRPPVYPGGDVTANIGGF